MSEPLTDEELDRIARGENWRTATCRACGKAVVVLPELSTFSCYCPSLQPPLSIDVYGSTQPQPLPIVNSPTGALASQRLVDEVRRLRLDDWLEKAAAEIDAYQYGRPREATTRGMLAILRKHRGGRGPS